MRKGKVIVWLLVTAVLLMAVGGGTCVYFLKSKWRHASGGVTVQTGNWLQHHLLTPAVLRDMPMPGLIGQPTHSYYCEGDDIEINHLHFQTTLTRDEVLRELETFIRSSGFEKTGPNFTRDQEALNVAYQKMDSETWVKLFMTRK